MHYFLDVSWQYHHNPKSAFEYIMSCKRFCHRKVTRKQERFLSLSLNNAKYVWEDVYVCSSPSNCLDVWVCEWVNAALYERESVAVCQAVWVSVCGMLSPAKLMWNVQRAQEKRIELLINIGSHANVHSPINATFKALLFYFNSITRMPIMSLSILFDLKTSCAWCAKSGQPSISPFQFSAFIFIFAYLRVAEIDKGMRMFQQINSAV